MHVSDLFIYPVKSLGGIRLQKAEVLGKGFRFDRRLMLVDESGTFISQRTEHQLALLHSDIHSTGITIRHNLNPEQTISIPFDAKTGNKIPVSVWDDQTEAFTLDKSYDSWFSKFLNRPCRLVFMPEDAARAVDERYAKRGEQVSFADAFPYLLIGENSLNDLNGRLNEPVDMNRFRPNIVISGSDAFEEDTWEEIRIGKVHFQVSKPCARCVLTTVDQNTAIKGKEPLATLARYRTVNKKVLFGQNLIALNEGIILAGDQLEVVRVKHTE